jgi:hypothetical protein
VRRTLLLLLAAALLGGCADDDPAVAPTPTPSPSLSPVVSTAEPQPVDPLSPQPAVESPAPLGQPRCSAADLTVVDADQYDVEEGVHEVFVLRTRGAPCQLEGWPAVSFQDAAGKRLPLTARHGGFGLPDEEPQPVTLSRSTSLSFLVGTRTDGSCRQAARIVVTLPGTSRALSAGTPLELCGPEFGVSPVRRLVDEE